MKVVLSLTAELVDNDGADHRPSEVRVLDFKFLSYKIGFNYFLIYKLISLSYI